MMSDFLPAPFAWIDIPGKGYSIAKYPITNAQFLKFVEADGYKQKKWWTDDGWTWLEEHKWIEPRFWHVARFKRREDPVVGVSWYDTVAFCLWMSECTGEKIMLPTEDQWQYAAQGDDGRTYSWGNDWDCKRCNNSVKPCAITGMTPVRQYEGEGDSPFGVVNMTGNVWEWCLTDYDTKANDHMRPANNRVLRGGSWMSRNLNEFHSDFRQYGHPSVWNLDGGFRISRS